MTKILNLPDVDLNAPDFYEASGTIVDNFHRYLSDDECDAEVINEEIITDSIVISKEKFTSSATDSLAKQESFQQRYDRLLFETEQLLCDMKTETVQVDLEEKVGVLHQNLKSMNSKLYQSNLEYIPKDSGSLSSLVKDINNFKALALETTPQDNQKKDQMVYHLMYNADLSKEHVVSAQLEARIANLERLVGLHTIDPVTQVVSSDDAKRLFTKSKTLVGALENLDYQLSILSQPHFLDQTIRKIHDANAQLERLLENKRKLKVELGLQRHDTVPATELTSREDKINTLYSQFVKLEPVSSMLPHIISRLKTLKSLHNEAAQFSETLNLLKDDNEHLQYLAQNTTKGIENLVESMNINQGKIKANIAALDARISNILK